MSEKKHIVVVCGYGCHIDTPLRPYLGRVFRFVQDQHPNIVIFCGGFTQKKSAPGVSEARLMQDYTQLNEWPAFMLKTLTDESSYTTYGNIENASRLIRYVLKEKDVQVTIFCEATRAANVIMLARHFMGGLVESVDDISVETASWERADPFKQASNLIYNKLAIKYPLLGLAEREYRRRVRRAEFI